MAVEKGEFISLLGPLGLRQDDDAADDRGLRHERRRCSSTGATCAIKPAKRGLGIVFQSYALFPHMTVAENVAFGLEMQRRRPRPSATRASAETLELVGLDASPTAIPRRCRAGSSSAWRWRARW